jgi:acyl-CoA dehydrogenase
MRASSPATPRFRSRVRCLPARNSPEVISELRPEVRALQDRLERFMAEVVYPNEHVYAEEQTQLTERWSVPPIAQEMKAAARAAGLWNLFLPQSEHGAGLTNREYAPLCEVMGRSTIAPEAFNCSAPDTGNMEVLVRYGTAAQKKRWLEPLLAGEIRSAFAMTEPDVASSDATNIRASIVREGDTFLVNGRKWWASGALDPRCAVLIVMGQTDLAAPTHLQQSMILVPRDAPGVRVLRPLTVFGYDDAPHGHAEIDFHAVRVPADNLLLGEGRGFEIAQGRLGPGRIHHCMRAIGIAERALELMCARVEGRVAFGRPLAEQGVIRQWIADSRIEIDQARLLTLFAAEKMDRHGNKAAKTEIAMIKVVAPALATRVIDRAIQAFGAAGVSQDFGLAQWWAHSRTLRLADGPDEVHRAAIAKDELRRQAQRATASARPSA